MPPFAVGFFIGALVCAVVVGGYTLLYPSPVRSQSTTPVYSIRKRRKGLFLIINNFNFTNPPEQRYGTNKDADSLENLFTDIGFDVRRKDDLTAEDIVEAIQHIASVQDNNYSCFGAAILSHGGNGGVYGTDRIFVRTEEIMNYFSESNCPQLKGKPKIFFIQACQKSGYAEDLANPNQGVFIDAEPVLRQREQTKIVLKADYFLGVATPLGYLAYRCPEQGSVFIRSIVRIFRQFASSEHLAELMTRVVGAVQKEGNQVPVSKSSLTKHLYFNPARTLRSTAGHHSHDE